MKKISIVFLSFLFNTAFGQVSGVEKEVLRLIDSVRVSRGLNILSYNEAANKAAEYHTRYIKTTFSNTTSINRSGEKNLSVSRGSDKFGKIGNSETKSVGNTVVYGNGKDTIYNMSVSGHHEVYTKTNRGFGIIFQPSDRFKRFNTDTVGVGFGGEINTVTNSNGDYREVAREILSKYMCSVEHRNQIIDADTKRVGVGISIVTLDVSKYVCVIVFSK